MNSFALEIEGLHKSYLQEKTLQEVKALNGLRLNVNSGEIFGLLGPNGAGKTSLISIITTLENAQRGTVKVFGYDVRDESEKTKPLLGVVGQEIITSGFFTVHEILQFHSGYYGIENNSERIEFLLGKLSLREHRNKKVKQLSGGMKRRLMIAKALVHKPKLLLLDEPTAGVDIELRESLWNFVLELKGQGVTVLLTTHYLQEAEVLCDRIAMINKGEIQCIGKTQELIKDLSRREIRVTLNKVKEVKHENLEKQQGEVLTFLAPAAMTVGEILSTAGIKADEILDLVIKEGGLEEAMKQVLKAERFK